MNNRHFFFNRPPTSNIGVVSPCRCGFACFQRLNADALGISELYPAPVKLTNVGLMSRVSMTKAVVAYLPFILPSVFGWTTRSKFPQSTVSLTVSSLFVMPSNLSSVRVKVLGVGGGIGSGKSAACKLLVSELECWAHIDSDSIAHTVYEPNSKALSEVVAEFGPEVLLDNGEIDRKTLGSLVFADITAMQRLERIVWPHVQVKIEAQIEQARSEWNEKSRKAPIIVVEAAVLLDAGWQEFLDGVWVVSVSHHAAIGRLRENRGLSTEEAEKRIAAQQARRGIGNLRDEVAANVVTAVIDNNGSIEDLKQRLAERLDDESAWYRRTAQPQI